jgi:hypothetical protein
MSKPTDSNWHPLGDLCIDTGTIVLCDPRQAQAVVDHLDLDQIGGAEDFVTRYARI